MPTGARLCVRINGVANQGDHIHKLLTTFASHLFRLNHFIRLPQPGERFGPIRVDEERWLIKFRSQFLDVPELQPSPIGNAIQDLECFDLVLVVFDELPEARQHRLGFFQRLGIETPPEEVGRGSARQ